ncbi:MAG: 3-keto-5-aminohexanoate cleavage protein [Chloroflexota bacterium]
MEVWDYTNTYEWMKRAADLGPVIITCAINGGIQGKESHVGLPETPRELAAAAHEAYSAGASIVHIHGRSPDNWADCTDDPMVFWEINRRIREACPDVIINNSTGGGPNTTMEDRLRNLDAMPEVASLNMGPDMSRFAVKERSAPLEDPHPNQEFDLCIPFTYGFIEQLAAAMQERGIKPEMEVYHGGQYWVAQELMGKGLVEPPYWYQYVMGYQTSNYPTPWNVIDLVRELPGGSAFSTIGIGRFQWPMVTTGLLLGGHVRVGLEDNLYLRRGQKLAGNAEAVEKVARIARELNREVATPAQTREILGLPSKPSSYTAPRQPTGAAAS